MFMCVSTLYSRVVVETELISGVDSTREKLAGPCGEEKSSGGSLEGPKWFVRAISEPAAAAAAAAAVALCQYWDTSDDAYSAGKAAAGRQGQEIGQAAGEETIWSRK